MESASSGRPGTLQKPGKARRAVACDHCRAKKIRCNGSIPCSNCLDRGEKCVVTRRRRPRQGHEPKDLSHRVQQIEGLLRAPTGGSRLRDGTTIDDLANYNGLSLSPGLNHPRLNPPRDDAQGTYSEAVESLENDDVLETNQSHYPSATSRPVIFIHQQLSGQETTAPGKGSPPSRDDNTQDIGQEDSSVYVVDIRNLEYYVKWIVSKAKSPSFGDIAKELTRDMARMLKMSETLSTSRAPELSQEIAWQYTKAYFEETPEEAFGIVDRTWFESRLREHFGGTKPDESSWYSLRNALWASGCRIVLSRTTSFREANKASWALFENALSAHTAILFLRTSMVGVQAIILMAYYSEGVGKMSLQYMLCSTAMRLVCSKGLHRQPARSWNISPREVKHRNWLFWSIYCLEKQVCSRSGRPSVMEDDEVSSQVPQAALDGQPSSTIYCQILIQLMRLSSAAKKRLSSATAMRQSPDQLIETVRDLNGQLDQVKHSVKESFRLGEPLHSSQLLSGLITRQAQSLQSHYFSLVLDINTPLTYPWSGLYKYARHDAASLAQIEAACNNVSSASRSAILATRQIHIDANCSFLIALYTPVYSFVNLFLHILRDVNTATTKSDLAILDIALGYVSNFEFTAEFEVSLPFVRKMCNYVRLAAEGGGQEGAGDVVEAILASDRQILDPIDFNPTPLPSTDYETFDCLPLEDFEAWSTLLPFNETGDMVI